MKFIVIVAIEQQVEVEADDWNAASYEGLRAAIAQAGKPVDDAWITGILVDR